MPKEQPVWDSELWQQSLVAAIRFNFSLLKFTFTFPNTKDIISYPFPRTSFLENSSHWCEWDLQSLYSLGNSFSFSIFEDLVLVTFKETRKLQNFLIWLSIHFPRQIQGLKNTHLTCLLHACTYELWSDIHLKITHGNWNDLSNARIIDMFY